MRASLSLLLTTVALIGCKKKDDEAVTKPPAPAVKAAVATVAKAPTPDELTLTGQVVSHQRSEVTADIQGKVIAVLKERGDSVKVGEPVVRLDVQTSALSQREASANLAAARAQQGLADEECKRVKALLDKGAITRSDYDKQTTECTNAQQQVAAAGARADMIAKSVSDGLVRAPFAGVIDVKNVSPGEWVQPGHSLFTLVDNDPLRVELSVPEAQVTKIAEGQVVHLFTVNDTDHETPINAKVTRIGAEIGKSRALIVEAQIDPGSKLVPGMFVEAHVVIGTVDRVVVPADAVFDRGGLKHVYVIQKGEAVDQIVALGPDPAAGQHSVELGLEPGQKIVAKPDKTIVDGVKIAE
ncbi:MAG TPA: efflux RND transporter periplasmic adaptor subunit [Kofleriaceae bacterium]|jgi:membrane fusion protein (multidrug efflux system)